MSLHLPAMIDLPAEGTVDSYSNYGHRGVYEGETKKTPRQASDAPDNKEIWHSAE